MTDFRAMAHLVEDLQKWIGLLDRLDDDEDTWKLSLAAIQVNLGDAKMKADSLRQQFLEVYGDEEDEVPDHALNPPTPYDAGYLDEGGSRRDDPGSPLSAEELDSQEDQEEAEKYGVGVYDLPQNNEQYRMAVRDAERTGGHELDARDDEAVIEEAELRGMRAFPDRFRDTHAYAEVCREFLTEQQDPVRTHVVCSCPPYFEKGTCKHVEAIIAQMADDRGEYIPFNRDAMEPDLGPEGDS